MSSISIQTFTGKSILPYLLELARLRIEVFREFPYLYEGSLEYEEKYVKTYSEAENSLFVLAFDGQEVIGASTGIPMLEADSDTQQAFLQHPDFELKDIFYFGESVLRSSYRGQGIGKRFFTEREAFARKIGSSYTTFCAVERSANHPQRPASYRPLDTFWQQQGYEKRPDLYSFYSWKEIQETAESPKKMVFWVKKLV